MINVLFKTRGTSSTLPPRMNVARALNHLWNWIKEQFGLSPTQAKANTVAQGILKPAITANNPTPLPTEEDKDELILKCKKQLKDLKISDSPLSMRLNDWEKLPLNRREKAFRSLKLHTVAIIDSEIDRLEMQSSPEHERISILKKALAQFEKGIFTSPYDQID